MWAGFVPALAIIVVMGCGHRTSMPPVTFFCASGLQTTVDPLVDQFERLSGLQVTTIYNGSGELLAQIALNGQGDLLLAADEHFNQLAVERGLAADAIPLVEQYGCLVLGPAIDPKSIRSWDDFFALPRISLPKPSHAAIGSFVARDIGEDQYQQALDRAIVTRENVTQIVTDLQTGVVDAGIVWNVNAQQIRNASAVPLASPSNEPLSFVPVQSLAPAPNQKFSVVAVSRLTRGSTPESSEQLIEFLEQHRDQFSRAGYATLHDDAGGVP